jgi:predicted nucleotidyltransferase component of viral defense system
MITSLADIKSNDAFLIWTMNFFAAKFRNHAVLKGGMVLRLLNCPRYTNDLDYIFIPYSSKKDVLPLFKNALDGIPDLSYELQLNSKCLRCILAYKKYKIQMEASIARFCESESISNNELATQHNLQASVINVMKRDIAFSHKIAAWNERSLMRDLYDIYFYIQVLQVKPDIKTLSDRLKKVEDRRLNKTYTMPLSKLIEKFELTRRTLTPELLKAELTALLPNNSLLGLDMKIQIALSTLVEYLSENQ